MTVQRDMFTPCLATVKTVQGELFPGTAVDERCGVCGALQVITEGGYITCPRGCLKLRPAVEVSPDPTGPDLFT